MVAEWFVLISRLNVRAVWLLSFEFFENFAIFKKFVFESPNRFYISGFYLQIFLISFLLLKISSEKFDLH